MNRNEIVPPSGKIGRGGSFRFWRLLFWMHDNTWLRASIKAALVKAGFNVRLYGAEGKR